MTDRCSRSRVLVRRPVSLVRPLRRLLVLLLTSVLMLAGCSLLPGDEPEATDSPDPDRADTALTSVGWTQVARDQVRAGGELRLAAEALPVNFNPQHTSNAGSEAARILEPTIGSAIRITADGGWEVDKNYARAVEVVKQDPLTIRVDLNRQAVWQGGTAITAADMVAFWKAQNGSSKKFEVRSTEGYDDITAVKPGDDKYSYTVTFDDPTTDWPRYVYPALPANVSSTPKLFNTAFTDRAISANGPYRVVSIDRDSGQVVQEPNPRWWGDAPRLTRITWQSATPEVQLEAMVAGDLDAIDVPTSLQADALAAALDDEDITIGRSIGTEWTQLTMNGATGPLKDVRVRRAIALALDRRAIAAQLTKPIDRPPMVLGSFILLPGQRGYVDQSSLISTDVAAAGKLLDDAGWKVVGADGKRARKGKPLTLDMPVPATTSTSRARASLIADQLAAVGIEVTLQTVPDADFFKARIIPLKFDLATFSHAGSAFPVVDAKRQFYPIDSGENFTGVEDDQLSTAWNKGIAALDETERFRVIKVLDKRLFRDVPLVPLGVAPEVALRSGTLANFGPAQFIGPDWTTVGFAIPSSG